MLNLNQLQEIESIIGCKIPERVTEEALNVSSPLWGQTGPYNFAFLTVEEHRRLQSFIQSKEASPLSQIPELKILWKDGESNFMGLFVCGPLVGRLALVGHDTNIDCAPLYRSLDGFIEATEAGVVTPDTEWPYRVDYPNTGDELQAGTSKTDIENDEVCAERIANIAASTSDPFRLRFLYSCISSLTSKENIARLVPMLESSDYHVCGRACSILGFHHFDAACQKMAQIAIDETNLARFCAVDGIGLMKTKLSQDILAELVRTGLPLPGNISTALRRSSFELLFKNQVRSGKKTIEWYVRFDKADKFEKIALDSHRRPSPWWKVGL